jgi:TRAP-type uncharacterized transport system fused permease subunit
MRPLVFRILLCYLILWIVLVIEATRRRFGWDLLALTIIFIIYMLFGRFTPGIFTHSEASFMMVVEHLYLVPEGMFNSLAGILARSCSPFWRLGPFFVFPGRASCF